jgi:DNA repair protein RecO (recombination protein O)
LFVKVARPFHVMHTETDRTLVHRELATPALVLRTRPYGESDRIVTFITEQHGKLTGIAKGAKNSRRRFGGTLEPFVLIRVVFRQRTSSDLAFLLRCELIGTLRAFTRDLDCFAAGSYVLELTDRMVVGRESGREVYGLVHDALALIDGGASFDPVLRAFELHLLTTCGYAPPLDHCGGCARPSDGTENFYLAIDRGGLVCRTCVRPSERVRPVSAATTAELARLAANPLAEAGEDRASLTEAAAVTATLFEAITPGRLHARGFMARARVDSGEGVR